MFDYSEDCVLLVLCSDNYDENDYTINDEEDNNSDYEADTYDDYEEDNL